MTVEPPRSRSWLELGVVLHLTLWSAAFAIFALLHPGYGSGSSGLRLGTLIAIAGFVAALWRARARRFAFALLNCASLTLLAVVAGEAALSRSQLEPTRYPYPYRYHGFAPNRRASDNSHLVTTNDTGLRAPGPIPRKRPGELRIVVLGGSAVLGVGSDDAYSPPALLESILRERAAARPWSGVERLTVINGGQGWYTSTQELVYFVTELVVYEPDLLLVIDGYNDAHHALVWGYPPPINAVMAGGYHELHATPGFMTDRRTWGQALHELLGLDTVVRRFGFAPSSLIAGDDRVQATGVVTAADPITTLVEPMRHRLLMNWTLLQAIASSRGLPARFALQPTIYPKRRAPEEDAWLATQPYAAAMEKAWRELERWVEVEASRLGVPTFRSDAYLREDPARRFTDYCHLTPEGNAAFARRLAEVVAETLDRDWPWTVRWEGVRYTPERGDPFFRPGLPLQDWR